MALAGFVCSADDRVDYTESRLRADALSGQAGPRPQRTSIQRRVLKGTGHRGAQGEHATAPRFGPGDRPYGRPGQMVCLIEGQPRVKCYIARRRIPAASVKAAKHPQRAPVSSSLNLQSLARASSSYAWSFARQGRCPMK